MPLCDILTVPEESIDLDQWLDIPTMGSLHGIDRIAFAILMQEAGLRWWGRSGKMPSPIPTDFAIDNRFVIQIANTPALRWDYNKVKLHLREKELKL